MHCDEPPKRLSARGLGFGATANYTPAIIIGGARHNGKQVLQVTMAPEAAERLRQSLPSGPRIENSSPVDDITLDSMTAPGARTDAMVDVLIAGPHDVMRFLAYDLDAQWG